MSRRKTFLVNIGIGLCWILFAGIGSACGDDDGGSEPLDATLEPDAKVVLPPVDMECPNTTNCPDQGDDTLYAGVSVVDITPQDLKEGPSFVDANGDGYYNGQDGDSFVDSNDNNSFDAIWIAGFDPSRPASGVHDPLEGRILALRYNETTVVLVTVDLLGFFYSYKEIVQSRLDASVAEQVDLILTSASHTHQGPDTIGIWGRKVNETGLDLDYLDWVYDQLALGIEEAVSSMEQSHVTFGAIQVEDATGNTDTLVGDGRDPKIIDKTMNVMRLFRPSDDTTIATVVEFASHPEWVGDDNNLITADYVYFLREAVETGDSTGIQGIGGVCLFISGALGGQIGPHHVVPVDREGNPQPEHGFARAQAIGESYAEFALRALDPAEGAVTVSSPAISFRTRRVFARVDNFLYQAAWRLGVFNRPMYNFNPEAYIEEGNIPEIITELVYLKLGPAAMISIPGELHPELFIGCYDGSCTGGEPIIDPQNPNPPNLGQAPQGPYLKDLMIQDGAQFAWCLGLTQDELGYIMPDYNFILDQDSPYVTQAQGDHYEETNSLGPYSQQNLIVPLEELIQGTGQ